MFFWQATPHIYLQHIARKPSHYTVSYCIFLFFFIISPLLATLLFSFSRRFKSRRFFFYCLLSAILNSSSPHTHTHIHTHRIFTVFPFSKRLCFVWIYPDDVRNASPSKLFAQKENKERERRERWRLDNARPSVLYMRVRDTPDTDIFRESRTIDVERES